jgi:hypothetical protein
LNKFIILLISILFFTFNAPADEKKPEETKGTDTVDLDDGEDDSKAEERKKEREKEKKKEKQDKKKKGKKGKCKV